MKVRLTIDMTDDERIALGLMDTGLFVPVTHIRASELLTKELTQYLGDAAQVVNLQREELRKQLVAKLTPGEVPAVTGIARPTSAL